MNIKEARKLFIESAKALRRMCDWEKNPFVFLCEAALIEYLSKMVYSSGTDSQRYRQFVEDYLGSIRKKYITFKYKNGKMDLPIQFYHVLRCGIVHSYSFIPDDKARSKGGRDRSIVIAHKQPGLRHLSRWNSKMAPDAACFVAEILAEDVLKAVKLIFRNAKKDASLRFNIEKRLQGNPPIVGNI